MIHLPKYYTVADLYRDISPSSCEPALKHFLEHTVLYKLDGYDNDDDEGMVYPYGPAIFGVEFVALKGYRSPGLALLYSNSDDKGQLTFSELRTKIKEIFDRPFKNNEVMVILKNVDDGSMETVVKPLAATITILLHYAFIEPYSKVRTI